MKAKDANGLEIGAGDRVVCVDPGVGLGMSSGGYDVLKVVDPWTIVVDASTNQHVMAGRFTAIQPVLSVKEAREAIAEAEKAFAQVETSFEDAKAPSGRPGYTNAYVFVEPEGASQNPMSAVAFDNSHHALAWADTYPESLRVLVEVSESVKLPANAYLYVVLEGRLVLLVDSPLTASQRLFVDKYQ